MRLACLFHFDCICGSVFAREPQRMSSAILSCGAALLHTILTLVDQSTSLRCLQLSLVKWFSFHKYRTVISVLDHLTAVAYLYFQLHSRDICCMFQMHALQRNEFGRDQAYCLHKGSLCSSLECLHVVLIVCLLVFMRTTNIASTSTRIHIRFSSSFQCVRLCWALGKPPCSLRFILTMVID